MPHLPAATPQALAAYLARIGFSGTPRADLATLNAVHRLHAKAIPYENLDVQLGRPVTRDPRAAFAKLVGARRGGWCYEMNGLMAWMLEAIGFEVTRLAGAVMREQAGDVMIGNHLVLLVELDRTYVADVGLGNGLVEAVPLEAGPIRQGFKRMELERLGDGWWRFRNHKGAMPPSFDFNPDVGDEALLEERCRWSQTDPASPFVVNAVLQRHFGDHFESLVGTTYGILDGAGTRERTIASAHDYARVLRERFGLAVPHVDYLWAKVSTAPRPDIPAAA